MVGALAMARGVVGARRLQTDLLRACGSCLGRVRRRQISCLSSVALGWQLLRRRSLKPVRNPLCSVCTKILPRSLMTVRGVLSALWCHISLPPIAGTARRLAPAVDAWARFLNHLSVACSTL